MPLCLRLSCLSALLLTTCTFAAERLPCPDRSGPTFYGHADPLDARGLPTTWDEATGENVAWKIKLEGAGHSTPVIGYNQLWFTSATVDGHTLRGLPSGGVR